MNCLPVGPHELDTPEKMNRYFRDLKRWKFDVPYNAFYAFPLQLVLGEWKQVYVEFARRAKEQGLPPCIQIQISVALAEDVPVEGNAQCYADDTLDLREPHYRWGRERVTYFASFASRAWRDHLKKLISVFADYGYEWVVLEEPMLRTDIPGKKDPMYGWFCERYPGVKYPMRTDDTEEYYRLQHFKRDVVVEFFQELTEQARLVGFKMIGCMPWFYTPTYENTPWETWNSSCDQGRLAYLPEMDFLVVRMQPDNLLAEATIAEQGEALPRQAYVEALAHHFGKPIVTVNNPTDEHQKKGDTESLIPYDFFAPYTLAAAAASPNGMTRHWYGANYGRDTQHMELMSRVNEVLPRLSTPLSPYAVMFSHAGVERVLPRGWRQSWQQLYFLTRQMMFVEGIPMHTLFAESIREQLERCPEIKCVFLLPFFPIPPEEVRFLREWVGGGEDRWLVFLGAHNGVTWNTAYRMSGPQLRPNEVVGLFGVDPSRRIRVMPFSDRLQLLFAGHDESESFWGRQCEIKGAGFPELAFKTGGQERLRVLYTTEEGVPVVFEKACGEKGGKALFVGCALDGATQEFPLAGLLSYLRVSWEVANGEKVATVTVSSKRPGSILWSMSRSGYLAVCNLDKERGRFRINLPVERWQLWEVAKKRLVESGKSFRIEGYSLRCFRMVGNKSSVLDVKGQLYLERIDESAGRALISGCFKPALQLLSRRAVSEVRQQGGNLPFQVSKRRKYYRIDIKEIREPRGRIEVRFKDA